MRRLLVVLAPVILALLAAGCGDTVEVREANLSARPTPATTTTPHPSETVRRPGAPTGKVRIAVVTHGQASDPFWSIVRTGINQAAHQLNASVTYSAPDTYDVARMRQLIAAAMAKKPDGLVVTIPDPRGLGSTIRAVAKTGIPVVSINSGTDVSRRLGVLVHIGQPDEQAGLQAGERFAKSGVRHALCVNQEVGNKSLDQRCAGFGAAMKKAHGSSTVVDVNLQDPAGAERRIVGALGRGVDGIMTLGPTGAAPALDALRSKDLVGKVKLATFDLSPDVITAVRRGQIEFAVDQQPFLQGYLPILFLTQYQRYGLLPDRGRIVSTGPSFVTRANADDVGRLADQEIR
ncbi:MAG: sugar ABC transporter substrate-binding protein [Gaiellaceae bacterium]